MSTYLKRLSLVSTACFSLLWTSHLLAAEPVAVQLLRQQNALLAQQNDKLLAVVQWSLGFALTVIFGILALIGYFTVRRYDEDKRSLEASISAKFTEVDAGLNTTLTNKGAELDTKFSSAKTDLEAKQAASAEELKNSISTIATTTVKQAIDPIKETLKSHRHNYLLLEYDVLTMQADLHEEKGVLGNSLTRHFEIAQVGRKLNYEWVISHALEDIAKLQGKGGEFSSSEVQEVTKFLSELPPEYEPLVKKVKEQL